MSPYRLATHLAMAFTTYTGLLWTALDVLYPSTAMKQAAAAVPKEVLPRLGTLRGTAALTAGVVFTTAISGAYVAGNDAGRAYNTWPTMEVRTPAGSAGLTRPPDLESMHDQSHV